LQALEPARKSRGLVVPRKPKRKVTLIDRIDLWLLSKSSDIDGLWVGSWEDDPHPGLRRVEEALRLIKRHDPLNYSRVTSKLDRIWVQLIPSGQAHYNRSLNACILDKRYLLQETTAVEIVASTIIHEATHARLEGWGIDYIEKDRPRIEAICLRRERNFLAGLPDSQPLQDQILRTLEWSAANRDYHSDADFQAREVRGQVETLRYLNAPKWLIRFALWVIWRRRLRASASTGS
jgi:hypothetical protein